MNLKSKILFPYQCVKQVELCVNKAEYRKLLNGSNKQCETHQKLQMLEDILGSGRIFSEMFGSNMA